MKTTHDLLVIGGGAAGLTASGIAVNLGASAVMIERHRLGGDCTWTGCVPSKTLLKAAHVAHRRAHGRAYGLQDAPLDVDFPALMEHVRAVRRAVYEEADAPPKFEAMGVDVRHGTARFVDAHTVAVTGADGSTARVSGRYVVIATGGRAAVPPIEGLDTVPYLTNETLFELETQPRHLAILGGGPIGTEMAQAFRRLGSEVTVIDRGDRLLGHDDAELAALLRESLQAEGVRFRFGATVTRVARDGEGVRLTLEADGGTDTLAADVLLVAAGRRPNVEDLGLDAAGVAFTEKGITVDDRCRTNVGHLYAVGDVSGRYQFTHMSEHMAKTAVTNALLKWPFKMDTAHVPWVTFTDPELAHVGATAETLEKAGTTFDTYRFPYSKLDRAITDGETTGLIKIHATGRGQILGASVLGARGGELISELALAMAQGVPLRKLSSTIHPYPAYSLGVRRAADQWYAAQQSAWMIRLLKKVFGYRGPVHTHAPGRVV